MARSSFYFHIKQSTKIDKYESIKNNIRKVYHAHFGRYGYRRITLELINQGFTINHKTVLRLMREMGLKSLIRVKKYRSYRGRQGLTAPNLLKREFTTKTINNKWATDITEFKVAGEKLYLSPIIDLCNREIVSYQLSRSPNFKQVTNMLKKAFKKIPVKANLMLHSDQGW